MLLFSKKVALIIKFAIMRRVLGLLVSLCLIVIGCSDMEELETLVSDVPSSRTSAQN